MAVAKNPGPKYRGVLPRIPPTYENVQVNFCKNPECINYGRPASPDYKHPLSGGKYHRAGGGSQETRESGLICCECRVYGPLKSNEEIVAETRRISAYLRERPEAPSCPSEACPNHQVPVTEGLPFYSLYGHTAAKSTRYVCKACNRRFSVKMVATHHQRRPDKNKAIFLNLVNHGPLKRIFEEEETGGGTVYAKIDFFYSQCRAFAAEQERQLLECSRLGFRRLYLSTDLQDYTTNWKVCESRRNVRLSAVGTADNESGFVFAMNLSFDPDADLEKITEESEPDRSKPEPFRKHGRYWQSDDYQLALRISQKNKAKRKVRRAAVPPAGIMATIREEAKEAGRRFNVDSSENMNNTIQLPDEGMQVKKDYLIYGHFFHLKQLFADNFGKLRFFFDYDSGLRSGCLTAFEQEIRDRRVDAAYVKISYGLPKPAKRALVNEAKRIFKKEQKKHPDLSEEQVKTLLMMNQMEAKESDMFWGDLWVHHPLPDMSEAQKMVSIQTNIGGFDNRHLANLMKKATLHGINRFFNVVRRRLQGLDRALQTASTNRAEYLIYGPYNPVHMVKVLEILRVYYNYALPVKQKHGKIVPKALRKTPAQYLGLADRVYTVDDILGFMPQWNRPAESVNP